MHTELVSCFFFSLQQSKLASPWCLAFPRGRARWQLRGSARLPDWRPRREFRGSLLDQNGASALNWPGQTRRKNGAQGFANPRRAAETLRLTRREESPQEERGAQIHRLSYMVGAVSSPQGPPAQTRPAARLSSAHHQFTTPSASERGQSGQSGTAREQSSSLPSLSPAFPFRCLPLQGAQRVSSRLGNHTATIATSRQQSSVALTLSARYGFRSTSMPLDPPPSTPFQNRQIR